MENGWEKFEEPVDSGATLTAPGREKRSKNAETWEPSEKRGPYSPGSKPKDKYKLPGKRVKFS
jgi:hypothetical protein